MIASKDKMRKEHVEFFYEEYGKENGLTKEDCDLLYIRSFSGLPSEKVVELGMKLKCERWQKNFFNYYIQHISDYCASNSHKVYRNVKIRLFGLFPLFSIRSQGDFL